MYSNYKCGFACELALIEWLQLDGCYTPIDAAWQIMLSTGEDSSKHWPGRAYIRRCLLLFKMMIVNLFTWIKSSLNDAGRNNCCSNFDTENSSSLFFLHMYTNLRCIRIYSIVIENYFSSSSFLFWFGKLKKKLRKNLSAINLKYDHEKLYFPYK